MNWILSWQGLGNSMPEHGGGAVGRSKSQPNGFMCVSKFTPRNRDEWTKDTRRGCRGKGPLAAVVQD